MTDLVLACEQVSRIFLDGDKEIQVLKDVSFSLGKGEQVAIMGASGSGKTTLLQILGGLDTPTSGQVMLKGKNISSMSEQQLCHLRNHSLGFIYQHHHLLPEFTALENVMMPLLIRKMPWREAMKQAQSILEEVGLGERLDHKPGMLSGGERQRTAIARAIVTKPDCILADEPTGNLDTHTAAHVYDLLCRLNRERGISFLIVTHDQQLADKMDRCYHMENASLL